MWNPPTAKQLEKLPKLYSGEDVTDKKIMMHFFLGGSDWYVTEYGAEDNLFFAFCILNGMYDCAEWGYVSLDELKEIKMGFMQVDRDLHWKVRKASEVDKIVQCGGVR